MTDQDKILIMSYLDNELDASEISSVESLIANDSEAQAYLNQLKITNIEVDAFFNSEDMKQLDTSISKFVEDLKAKETVSTFQLGELISNFFFSKQLFTYSLTAMVFLTAGLLYNTVENDLILFDLDSTVYEKQILITRSLASDKREIKSLISQTIDEMLQNNSREASLIYGSQTYLISLESKTVSDINLNCYSGKFFSEGILIPLVFCKSSNDTSLIYTN